MLEITKEEFLAFEEVRQSGMTNMFDINKVKMYSGLSSYKIKEIMKGYHLLKTKHMGGTHNE